MALVLHFRSVCTVGCIICCLFIVSLSGNYQNQEQTDSVQLQQLEEKSQQHNNNRDGQQPLDITLKSQSNPSSSVPRAISSSSRVSATKTKRAEKPGVSSTDSVQQSAQEITGFNRDDADYIVDDGAENVDAVYISSKRQPTTERNDELPSTSTENAEDINELENEERQLRNTITASNNVDSLKNKLNPVGIEIIFPSKEEYLHRYYGINRKGRRNINQERKKEQKQEDVISSLDGLNPMTGSASHVANSPSYRDGVNAEDEEITEDKRQEEDLYVFDKHVDDEIDDEIDDYAEDDEYDNLNYAENISKYNGGRVKRRVVRGRDDWANEDDRSVDYAGFDSRERGKDRHGGGRGRGRTGRGRGSNPNGYDRNSQEMDPDIDPSNYDPDQAEYRAAPAPRRSRSGNGKGGGGRRTEGGGDGRGRRAGQDRRYGNRHHEPDGSERGYTNRGDGYPGERSHSESSSSSPPLSPSRHPDSYGRYSQNPTGTRSSKSTSDKTCHICAMKKMDREIRLRALKAQIIKQIGLNELPNITKNDRILSKVPALKYIIENMTMQRDEPSWRDSPGEKSMDITEQMIITAEKPNHLLSHFGYNLSGLCYFNVSGRLKTSIIKEATLWLYLRPQSKIRRSLVEVRIWDAVDRVVHPDPLKVLKVEIGRFGEWAHVKATSIIKQWVKNMRLNYGLNITAFDSYGNNRIWTPNIPNHAEEYPVMDIKFSPRRHSRHRRTVGQMCTDEEHTGRCCLYPLMVDFLEMKWYWVIYPHNFEANYCSGNCSLEIIDDTLPYAYIGFKSASTIDGVRCCTSTREGELQILYYTNANKIIHTQIEDIVVKECGCR